LIVRPVRRASSPIEYCITSAWQLPSGEEQASGSPDRVDHLFDDPR
jgi:hypothetical protein